MEPSSSPSTKGVTKGIKAIKLTSFAKVFSLFSTLSTRSKYKPQPLIGYVEVGSLLIVPLRRAAFAA